MADAAVTVENWFHDPFGTRSLQRVDEFRPTAPIPRGASARSLPEAPFDLGGIELEGRDGSTITLDEHLVRSRTEGLIVLKDGAVVFERYLNGLQPDTRHIFFSVTKSVCASTLGIAVERGQIGLGDLVGDIDPMLAGTALGSATVQQVIDMTAGIDFLETYDELSSPDAETAALRFFRQCGLMPLEGADPVGVIALLGEYGLAYPHGERFEYRTPLTCTAGHLLEIATGRPWNELAAEVWAGIGAEHDASVVVDVAGQPFAGGGMLGTLRDLARYGQLHLEGGGETIPDWWIDATREGTEDTRRAFDLDPHLSEIDLEIWDEYRNAFWVIESGRSYEALGIYGQVCRINDATGTVMARFSAHPTGTSTDIDYELYRAHAAIDAALA